MDFKEEIIKLLKKEIKEEITLEIPPDYNLGDYALPCFSLARILKKNPNEIALELSKKIKAPFLEKTEAKGPYLNFFIERKSFIQEIIPKSLKKDFGRGKEKDRILLEFPSPNTNKPLHLGHLRNISLGVSVSNILSYLGNKVMKVNLNNDRGVHICKSMLAYQLYGNNKKPNKKTDHFVGDFYVLFSKKASENPELEQKAQDMLVLWEKKDKKVRSLWKKINSWALNGFKETYKQFNLKFDKVYNESEFYEKAKDIVHEYFKNGLFRKDEDGAIFIELNKLGKKILLRADDTSIYITQDIYLAILKNKDFKIDKSIYVVGSEQNYHFQVLFKILELMNVPYAKNCRHLSYGMVYLPEGKMKSREGTVVDADDIIKELKDLAYNEVIQRETEINKKEAEKRAKKIGLSALIFYLLKPDTASDIYFNPKESISFEGETGPYLQYTAARINSILRKLKKDIKKADLSLLNNQIEFELVKLISSFPETLKEAGDKLKPYLIARLLLDIAQKFNNYYHSFDILKEEERIRNARIMLIKSVRNTLEIGLKNLGIETLERM